MLPKNHTLLFLVQNLNGHSFEGLECGVVRRETEMELVCTTSLLMLQWNAKESSLYVGPNSSSYLKQSYIYLLHRNS